MPRRKTIAVFGIALLLLTFVVAGLWAVIKHEPNFYHQTQLPEGEGRRLLWLKTATALTQMNSDKNSKLRADWGCEVTEDGLNSLFAEIFSEQNETEGLRRIGISSPSVVLEDDHVRLGFRYDAGWISTVVSYDLKVWLVPKEPNMIAVEFLSARAGALPISSQAILQQLCDAARKQDFKVNLYRHDGNSVAVIQLQPNDNHPTGVFTVLQVSPQKLTIRGRTAENALIAPAIPTSPAQQ